MDKKRTRGRLLLEELKSKEYPEKFTQACSRCHRVILKVDGCNKMTCEFLRDVVGIFVTDLGKVFVVDIFRGQRDLFLKGHRGKGHNMLGEVSIYVAQVKRVEERVWFLR
jgi:hypothetical protein